MEVSANTWKCQESASLFLSVAHFSPLRLFQKDMGEVLSNMEATQDFLNTNTTLIIKTVSRATDHMSWKEKLSMWSDNACVWSVI